MCPSCCLSVCLSVSNSLHSCMICLHQTIAISREHVALQRDALLWWAFLSACQSVLVCLRAYLRKRTSKLRQIFCACQLWPWLGPPLAALGNTLCTSSFVDDMFSSNGPCEAEEGVSSKWLRSGCTNLSQLYCQLTNPLYATAVGWCGNSRATSANSSSIKWVSQLTVQLTEIGATGPKWLSASQYGAAANWELSLMAIFTLYSLRFLQADVKQGN